MRWSQFSDRLDSAKSIFVKKVNSFRRVIIGAMMVFLFYWGTIGIDSRVSWTPWPMILAAASVVVAAYVLRRNLALAAVIHVGIVIAVLSWAFLVCGKHFAQTAMPVCLFCQLVMTEAMAANRLRDKQST